MISLRPQLYWPQKFDVSLLIQLILFFSSRVHFLRSSFVFIRVKPATCLFVFQKKASMCLSHFLIEMHLGILANFLELLPKQGCPPTHPWFYTEKFHFTFSGKFSAIPHPGGKAFRLQPGILWRIKNNEAGRDTEGG